MLAINMDDVINVLNSCKPYLIALGIALAIAIIVTVACMKLKKPVKKLVRKEAWIAFLMAAVVIINLICFIRFGSCNCILPYHTSFGKNLHNLHFFCINCFACWKFWTKQTPYFYALYTKHGVKDSFYQVIACPLFHFHMLPPCQSTGIRLLMPRRSTVHILPYCLNDCIKEVCHRSVISHRNQDL